MSSEAPRPENGGRVEVRLLQAEADARYEVLVCDARSRWATQAALSEAEGRVTLEPWQGDDPVPEWLERAAHTLLRSAWQRKRAGNPWPRRLARWRPDPDSGDDRPA